MASAVRRSVPASPSIIATQQNSVASSPPPTPSVALRLSSLPDPERDSVASIRYCSPRVLLQATSSLPPPFTRSGSGMDDATSSSSRAPGPKTEELDAALHAMGFEIERVSPAEVTGRLLVTPTCCQVRTRHAHSPSPPEPWINSCDCYTDRWMDGAQPFKVLHGGVSALIAEGLASMGAHMASGYSRVAGVQLSINHFRSAALGDTVLVRAAPLHVGRSTQVTSPIILNSSSLLLC